jgi:hypothetical protein
MNNSLYSSIYFLISGGVIGYCLLNAKSIDRSVLHSYDS